MANYEMPTRIELSISGKLYRHAVEQARMRSQTTRQFLAETLEGALASTRLTSIPAREPDGERKAKPMSERRRQCNEEQIKSELQRTASTSAS